MKGIVFTELMDMVDDKFGPEMMDHVFDECELESEGAYTAVGTYDYKELLEIVNALSKRTQIPAKALVYTYGHYLFGRFNMLMPQFFEKPESTFEFLESVHGYIHVEVKKLYPDAKLPDFTTERTAPNILIMTYKSNCPFSDFAHGLMQGCIDFYNEDITINMKDNNTNEHFCRIFTLNKQ